MYHDLPRSASFCFWSFLLAVDVDLAEETRKKGCSCGGRLHSADYPRKPRGARLQLTECFRLSLCCDRDGCRKRATPPSVRFLGRKVYLGAIVILVSAMRQGPTPRRVSELSKHFGADESTIARWQTFWREHFPQTHFWKVARATLITYGEIKSLPYSLVDAFLGRHPPCEGWTLLLRFISPITVPGGLQIKVSQ